MFEDKKISMEMFKELNKELDNLETMPEKVSFHFTLTGKEATMFRFLMKICNQGMEGGFIKRIFLEGMYRVFKTILEKTFEKSF